jgi:integrase
LSGGHPKHSTAASLAVSARANVKAVRRMLGHAKASMTLDTYADLFDDDLDEPAALMVGKDRNALVFTDMRGGVLRNSNWRARVFALAVAACQESDESFPSITPHDLRHTAASLAISAGANVKAVQRMLGHAKASMTLDVYADLFDTDLDAVAVELDAAIRAVAGRG